MLLVPVEITSSVEKKCGVALLHRPRMYHDGWKCDESVRTVSYSFLFVL